MEYFAEHGSKEAVVGGIVVTQEGSLQQRANTPFSGCSDVCTDLRVRVELSVLCGCEVAAVGVESRLEQL